MPIKFDQSVNNVVIGKASLIQKIRGVLGLSQVETINRRSNLKTQKLTKVAKIFQFKIMTEEILDFLNASEVIIGDDHIINIKEESELYLCQCVEGKVQSHWN